MKTNFLFILITILISSCSKKMNDTSWSVSSPDGKLVMRIFPDESNNEGDQLFYEVSFSEEDSMKIIKPSLLGIVRHDQSFSNLVFVSESAVKEGKESYELVTGKKLKPEDRFSEKEITFENADGKKLTIVMRVFNNGVAFRYLFPDKDTTQYSIREEVTEFNIGINAKAWMQPYEKPGEWGPAYETPYENGIPSGTASPEQAAGWCFPALFHTNDTWVLLTEANIEGSFYGAHLQPQAPDGKYKIALPGSTEALNHYPVEPKSSLPWAAPWRLIMIGRSLGSIVESTLVTSLSAPNKIGDVSWIKPGRASWSWWSDHTSPRDYNKIVPFIDLASEMGWEYSLIDANWNTMQNGNIEKLIRYAKSKNVGLLLWYNSGGVHTEITEQPRDIMSDPVKRKAEFKKLHDWGIKGVKVDFFNSDKPVIMKYYQDILKDAADQQILVDFHGCTLPRGWERTYPNLMSMEGVRGAEQYWDKVFAENAQTHHAILPCTRNVVGSMDYTPVTFTHSEVPHLTTYAHELALAVLFESGITHYADRVSGYKSLPAEVQEVLKGIPTAWDETKFLQGFPGKDIVLARRKGNDWFVAGINGEKMAKELSVDLSFIGAESYSILFIQDGDTPVAFKMQNEAANAKTPFKVNMLGRGGFIIRLIGK